MAPQMDLNAQILQKILDTVNRLETSVNRLEVGQGELRAGQEELKVRMTSVEDRLTSVEDRLTRVEDRLTGVEDRLTSVEDRLTSVEDRLTRVEGDTSSTRRLVVQIADDTAANAVLATKLATYSTEEPSTEAALEVIRKIAGEVLEPLLKPLTKRFEPLTKRLDGVQESEAKNHSMLTQLQEDVAKNTHKLSLVQSCHCVPFNRYSLSSEDSPTPTTVSRSSSLRAATQESSHTFGQ